MSSGMGDLVVGRVVRVPVEIHATGARAVTTNSRFNAEAWCAQEGVAPLPPKPSDRLGLARVARSEIPIHGVRVPPTPSVSGWYIWAGDMLANEEFFEPTHVVHLADVCPLAGCCRTRLQGSTGGERCDLITP